MYKCLQEKKETPQFNLLRRFIVRQQFIYLNRFVTVKKQSITFRPFFLCYHSSSFTAAKDEFFPHNDEDIFFGLIVDCSEDLNPLINQGFLLFF